MKRLVLTGVVLFCLSHYARMYTIPKQNNENEKNEVYIGVDKRSAHTGNDPHPSQDNGSHVTNTSDDTTHHSDDVKNKHISIHVASWNFDHVKTPFIVSVFLMFAGIAKLGFHKANFLSSKVPESCLLIILGLLVGAILFVALPANNSMPGLTADLFFLYLLPPIILESAYSLHDRSFYENVGTVLIYAGIGTILNCFLIGPTLYGIYKAGGMGDNFADMQFIQCLVYSAIVVAVDPVAVLAIFQEVGVNNTLYFLVFGESLLNDAVTVVLYNMMKTFNLMDHITIDQIFLSILQFFVVSFGGLAIGIIYGALTAIITKFTEHCRVVEPLAVFVLAYLSYLTAEMFHFSGIISIIGCGLTQAQYAFHNISRKSYTTVKYFSKMMSATNDCIIFMFLGTAVFRTDVLNRDYWHPWFILWSILFCLIYRFLVVFVLTFFINRNNRVRKIDLEEQFIMAYGGLRGAVAFSLVDVLSQENLPKGHFLNSTLIVIFFTVFIQGSTIKPLVKILRVRMESQEKVQIGEEINLHVTDHVMAGMEEIIGQRGEHYIREAWEYYNRHYLKKWLQRDPISVDEQIMQLFEKIALEQHFENLAGSKMIQEKYGSQQELFDDLGQEYDEIKDEKEESEVGSLLVSIPSMSASSEDISPELDAELLRHQMGDRRKSYFPVNMDKGLENRLALNPTAEDVRKIIMPQRRQMNYRRLDRNLKSDDSENDLLRFLQSKQARTRRMSHALWNQPIVEGRETPVPAPAGGRRKSVAPTDATYNYKRRLSSAVPGMTPPRRLRGVSVGNVLKGLDSPGRRRLKMRRRTHSEASEKSDTMSPALTPLQENGEHEKVGFILHSDNEESDTLGVIEEKSNERTPSSSPVTNASPVSTSSPEHTKSTPTDKHHGKLQRQSSSPEDRSLEGDAVRSKDKMYKLGSQQKDSPSAVKRSKFKAAKSHSLESPTPSDDRRPPPRVHKNVSYARAMSLDNTIEEGDEEECD